MNLEKPRNDDYLEINGIRYTHAEIQRVVEIFYAKVAGHRHLKIPFSTVHDWPYHIEKLTHFWWIRFGGRSYMDVQYNPVQKHFETGFSEEFLDMWLSLFKEVLTTTLTKEQAKLWYMVAESTGTALTRHNEFMKKQYGKS